MPNCTHAQSCWFYRYIMPDLREIAQHLETAYCRGDYGACARFVMQNRFGQDNVPLGLFPHDHIDVRNSRRHTPVVLHEDPF